MFGEWDGHDVATFWVAVGAAAAAAFSAWFAFRTARRAHLSAPDVAWTLFRPGQECLLRNVGVRTARQVRIKGDLTVMTKMPFDLASKAEVGLIDSRGFGDPRNNLVVTWRSRWHRRRSWETWIPDAPSSPFPTRKPLGER
jgi:hypothetical protein